MPEGNALSLSWVFGFSRDVPLHNLCDQNRSAIFYVSAHTGVIYDLTSKTQQLLQQSKQQQRDQESQQPQQTGLQAERLQAGRPPWADGQRPLVYDPFSWLPDFDALPHEPWRHVR